MVLSSSTVRETKFHETFNLTFYSTLFFDHPKGCIFSAYYIFAYLCIFVWENVKYLCYPLTRLSVTHFAAHAIYISAVQYNTWPYSNAYKWHKYPHTYLHVYAGKNWHEMLESVCVYVNFIIPPMSQYINRFSIQRLIHIHIFNLCSTNKYVQLNTAGLLRFLNIPWRFLLLVWSL